MTADSRVALVTGGTRGLGRAVTAKLARSGVPVAAAFAHDRDAAQAMQDACQSSGATLTLHQADVGDPASCQRLVDEVLDRHGRLDYLVNNAGMVVEQRYGDVSVDDWQRHLAVNLSSAFYLTQAALDHMIERGFGRIVNIVSRSVKAPHAELGLSNGARSGLIGFVAGLARQTVRHNVTINNLLPGAFATDAQVRHIQGLVEQSGQPFEKLWEERGRANPAGRYGQPEELGALCAYICSMHTGYMTGQNILIDGGGYPGTY